MGTADWHYASMSNSAEQAIFPAWADRLLKRAPRLAVLAAIAVVWAATLAWPPTSRDARQDESGGSTGTYPVRMALADSRPMMLEELAALSQGAGATTSDSMQLSQTANEAGMKTPANRFSVAFASLIDSAVPPGAGRTGANQASRDLAPGELLKVDYDIGRLVPNKPQEVATEATASNRAARFNSEDGSLTVTKPLLVDGKSQGNATIRIEDGAQVLIATASVADALGEKADALPRRISGALATRSGFIPFHELRGAGIVVEYDPVTDRVSLSTKS